MPQELFCEICMPQELFCELPISYRYGDGNMPQELFCELFCEKSSCGIFLMAIVPYLQKSPVF